MRVFFISLVLVFASVLQIFPNHNPRYNQQIDQLLQLVPRGTNFGVLIIDPLTNDTVYVHNATALMIPASVTKLFTTLTAMTVLGPNYMLSTKLLTADKNLRDGVIDGDLIIKGYGNSLFTSDSLRAMVNKLARMGIHHVRGNIIGDDTFFDNEYYRRDWIEDEPGGGNIPPISALVLDRNMANETTVTGKKKKKMRVVRAKMKNPAEATAKALYKALTAAGIVVDGQVTTGAAPAQATEIAASSVRLKDLIRVINKRSDNFLAECLFKTVGAVNSKKEGSAFYAVQALYQFLERHDIVTDGLQISDGSGLSHYNLVTVRSVVSLLEWAYLNLSDFSDFQKSLSVAGDDGTLRNRMHSMDGASNFYGKTGTLNGLSSIAGYLHCKNGNDLIVAMIFEFNQSRARYYKNIQDRIIEALAGYN